MDVSKLKPGDDHYMAYVGPPAQYDFMGATQFRLLCTLGLRSNHYLLDFGCGSLRAGRLFLSYLDEGRYFGIEPNAWLIKEAIKYQVGNDLIALKKPRFDHNGDFKTDVFTHRFDFIIAQSIFSHSGRDLIHSALHNFKQSLKPDGLVAATFIEGPSDFDNRGWVYPDCVEYRPSTIVRLAEQMGFFAVRIPWYHPRQTWYLLANEKNRLPRKAMYRHLSGAVLFDQEFIASWNRGPTENTLRKIHVLQTLPQAIRNRLRKFLAFIRN